MIVKDDTVNLDGLQAEMWRAALVIEAVHWEMTGRESVITRGVEHAKKSIPTSLHPDGLALDYRTWYVRSTSPVGAGIGVNGEEAFAEEVRNRLGDEYDVVVIPGSHMHVEYDPDE